jgi:hypothetical protein
LPKMTDKAASVCEVIIKLKYVGTAMLKKLTCLLIDFPFYHTTLQVVEIISIQDKTGKEVKELVSVPSKHTAILKLQPVTKGIYFENLWKSDSVLLRGQHYNIIGFGKVQDVVYNFKK